MAFNDADVTKLRQMGLRVTVDQATGRVRSVRVVVVLRFRFFFFFFAQLFFVWAIARMVPLDDDNATAAVGQRAENSTEKL